MPKLWRETIETHRNAVRDAVLEVAQALVARHGLRGVTMSDIAEGAGVGRATLYKYFADVEAVLLALHERLVGAHMSQLADVMRRPGGPAERMRAVLEAYAQIVRERGPHHDAEIAAVLHRQEATVHAQDHLRRMIAHLVKEGADAGVFRRDASPDELAAYCLAATTAASGLTSQAAIARLVEVTMNGLETPKQSRRRTPARG
jgi:AcrR family transcriptional regulator